MSRLPRVLSALDLPAPELQSALLDGELHRVGEQFCAIDEPDGAAVRAASLAISLPQRYIAERRTAGWVWGGLYAQPTVIELCASLGARMRPQLGWRVATREVAIDADELVELSGLLVTTPIRTVCDLARHAELPWREATELIARLCSGHQLSLADCLGELDRRAHLPIVRLARRRLVAAISPS